MADWLDQVDTTSPATQKKSSNGDWLDNVDVTPGSSNPLTDALSAAQPWADIGTRTGIRVMTAPLNLLAAAPGAIAWGAGKLGMKFSDAPALYDTNGEKIAGPAPTTLPTPSESIIHSLGMDAPPDQTPAQQTTESIAPFLFPTGNQISRVLEAAGPFNKAMTFGRSELGNAADWFMSTDMQKWAADHGYSPAVQTILGILGASGRHLASAAGGKAMPLIAGREGDESGQNYDANRAISPNAPPLKSVVDPNSGFGKLSSGFSAFPGTFTGERGAINAQESAIKSTADDALQQFAPGTTSVEDAGPASLNDFSTDLGNQARAKILANEQELKQRSDAIEAAIDPNRRVSAQPVLDAALSVATDPNAGSQVRSAAEAAYHRILSNVNPTDGSIAFNALKTERSTFGALVDNMFQPSSGARTAKDTVARNISPIEDAMSAQMQQAANDAGQGPAWRQLDQDWSAHGKMKQQLAPTAGVLNDANAPQPWETYATSDDITSNLKSAVKGGDMPTIENISALGRDAANRSVAETIAATGRPANSKSVEKFRPDLFGEQADKTNKDVKAYIEAQAPGAGTQLQGAIDAAKTTAAPMERGGLLRTLASLGAGGATALGAGTMLGAPGVAALPFGALLTSALNDPSFIRAVAGRQFTAENLPGLIAQYAQHAGVGARPDAVDPVAALKSGVGQAATAASNYLGDPARNVVDTLLKYATGGQR
jgi:hypothetical protein